jgi:hypothetical protein
MILVLLAGFQSSAVCEEILKDLVGDSNFVVYSSNSAQHLFRRQEPCLDEGKLYNDEDIGKGKYFDCQITHVA